ncbi:phosphatidylinositol 3,4,5-trisphosphate 3-phosphatase and protein-tyrosine-phosphatase PTEN2A-like [Vigna unguiculata]|uniref:phosphatidylinositol 3,4,5-trisphosphate 3-phosphatase and protein-tyrosine-phosphatase PTEN2A-like n=1 Tax=Vigna unguiculata TaxID=3917 RepID=UPI001016C75D|nr:phosphatidylinositol 3,4,5-trisphosphate 3-phosphatase and protein-tyrosine-phosphatase PTEN2A-like [Vigna unguiculata]XP_027914373.1 phosphatidylinositol 3,4,5-trisphosphate 3-phosphatase and protein-tyrosine-phosphatase PTEN2A-like [Vigna unguiculata]
MEPAPAYSSSQPTPPVSSAEEQHQPKVTGQINNAHDSPSSTLPASGMSLWTRHLKIPGLGLGQAQQDSQTENTSVSAFARLTGGLGLLTQSKESAGPVNSGPDQSNLIESFAKGLMDSSKSAVKAVQVKARHIVSQNKRRYQEDGFDLDMTYITENIIAMGFPGGDISSGIVGYIEGFYRNHMEEVIKFFETHHKGKYKVYNLCSERLYDGSLFQGKVATFPFSDHNCPPIQLITSFCQSAYSWLKEDIQNVVVVHCKAGMGRTGLMICCLLLSLKFFPTAEEAIDYFNHKRCVDGKALVLPSQIRYVKYFERTLTQFNGEVQPGRRCILRGFRLQRCPYWVRPSITISDHKGVLFATRNHPKTKDLLPEDFWISAPKKGIVVFALPGEPGLAELEGDFKIHFNDRQGDFYCWMNTTMIENRKVLDGSDFDGFDKRKIPTPGFRVEVVMIDYNETLPSITKANPTSKGSDGNTINAVPGPKPSTSNSTESKPPRNEDDVFSDSDEEESRDTQSKKAATEYKFMAPHQASEGTTDHVGMLTNSTDRLSLQHEAGMQNNSSEKSTADEHHKVHSTNVESVGASDIKAIAADASVFSFGDEDFESD